jgi:hypothetical protein
MPRHKTDPHIFLIVPPLATMAESVSADYSLAQTTAFVLKTPLAIQAYSNVASATKLPDP